MTTINNMTNDATVVASNRSNSHLQQARALEIAAAIKIARDHAIADTGATSIFIMDGVNVDNK